MTDMDWISIITLVVGFAGGGVGLVGLVTLASQQKRAEAEAKGAEASTESTELDNVDKAVKIWRDLAESMEQRNKAMQKNYEDLLTEVRTLRSEVKKQNSTINKILKIVDSIDHDNLEQKVKECKEVVG